MATFVAQIFSCLDREHCFIRERAQWQLLLLKYLVAWIENTALYESARTGNCSVAATAKLQLFAA